MDPNLVYQKTDAGEEAMRQRTKVVQRNQRMVLILVDGKASVADLCDKTGNPQMTVAALRDLEKDGFVVPLSAIESAWMWEQSRKIAQEIKAAVSQMSHLSAKKSPAPPPAAEPLSEYPVLHARIDAAKPERPAPKPAAPSRVEPKNSFADEALSTFSVFETEAQVREAMRRQQEPVKTGEKPAEKSKMAGKRRIFQRGEDRDDLEIKPIRRGPRKSGMGWTARLVLGTLFTVAVVVATALLFPYGRYLPEIEAALSQGVGRPAKIGAMNVVLFPKPGLFLSDVRLGEEAAKTSLRIAEVRLLPEPGSLLSPRVVFRDVELNGLSLSPESLLALPGLFAAMAQPASPFAVQRLALGKVGFKLRGLGVSGLSGRVELDQAQALRALWLETADRTLRIESKVANASAEIALEGYGWRPFEGSPLIFDLLKIKGVLLADALRAENINIHIFDGAIQGSAIFDAENRAALSSRLTFERVNSRKLGEALGLGSLLEGEMSGRIDFSSLATAWGDLLPALMANGEFAMRRGAIHGADLAEALRRSSSGTVRGGVTRFEQFVGNFRVAPDDFRLHNLSMASGLMQSTGTLAVGKNQQLSGSMNVLMRGSANQLSVPITVGGTLKTPELHSVSR